MTPNLDMIVDVVDNSNRVIGTAPRRKLLAEHLNFRTAHALLFDEHNYLMIQRLPKTHMRNPDKLGSSVAGYLYSGEGYQSAITRRVRQELGIIPDLRDIAEFGMSDSKAQKFVHVFAGNISSRPTDFDHAEIAELLYLSREELRVLIGKEPTAFTPTFLQVYEHYENSLEGRNGRRKDTS